MDASWWVFCMNMNAAHKSKPQQCEQIYMTPVFIEKSTFSVHMRSNAWFMRHKEKKTQRVCIECLSYPVQSSSNHPCHVQYARRHSYIFCMHFVYFSRSISVFIYDENKKEGDVHWILFNALYTFQTAYCANKWLLIAAYPDDGLSRSICAGKQVRRLKELKRAKIGIGSISLCKVYFGWLYRQGQSIHCKGILCVLCCHHRQLVGKMAK